LSAEEQQEQSWRNSLWNLFAGDDVNIEVIGEDETKAAARLSPKYSRKQKIQRRTIFNMAAIRHLGF